MCGAAANSYGWIDPGTMNNVVLTSLTPSTTYYYSYGDPVCNHVMSPCYVTAVCVTAVYVTAVCVTAVCVTAVCVTAVDSAV